MDRKFMFGEDKRKWSELGFIEKKEAVIDICHVLMQAVLVLFVVGITLILLMSSCFQTGI